MFPKSWPSLTQICQYGFIALYLVLFLLAATDGPDLYRYMHWTHAFRTLDLQPVLAEGGQVLSPMGVPLSQASHGPGLLLAVCPAFCDRLVDPYYQGLYIGWAYTVIFWAAMLGLIRYAANGDARWTILGVLIAILGTHLGFYSRSYASESFSHVLFAVMALWAVTRKQWKISDAWLMGCLAGLLMINRSHLLLYTAPLLGMMAFSLFQSRKNVTVLQAGFYLLALFIPLAISFIQIGLSNRWMTGDFSGSPYYFGNDSFKSVDFSRPELPAILFQPLHGLFTYHPFYAVGFLALVILAIKAKSVAAKLFYAGFVAIILFHVYLQAGWYVWWLGRVTFGMRGLSLIAVILVPAFIKLMREREGQQKSNAWPVLAATAACLWSTPLFYASLYQEVQFYTYADLLQFQAGYLEKIFNRWPLLAGMLGIPLLGVPAMVFTNRLRFWWEPFVTSLKQKPVVTMAQLVLFPLSLYALVWYNVNSYAYYLGAAITAAKYAVIVSVPIFVFTVGVFTVSMDGYCQKISAWLTKHLNIYFSWLSAVPIPNFQIGFALATIILFMGLSYKFAKLAVHIEANIAACSFPTEQVRYVSSVHIPEIEESYLEYLYIPGFEAKKESLRQYLAELTAANPPIEDKNGILPLLKLDCAQNH